MNKINLIDLQKGRLFDPEFKFNHSCVLTYTIDLSLYEKLLWHFLASGSTNNILIADKNQLLKAQNSQAKFLSYDSSVYVFHGASTKHIFHPKSILFVGDTEIRLFIGSGNLTMSGLSTNQELYFEFTTMNETHRQAISDFLQYLKRFINTENLDLTTLNRLIRLFSAAVLVQKQYEIPVQSSVSFIHNLDRPIIDQVHDLVSTCKSLTIISPFYDKDFKAIHMLKDLFTPEVQVYLQPEYTNFNKEKYSAEEFPVFNHNLDTRSLHAKMFIFEEENEITLLYGSPNCTFPALFSTAKNGNTEIAILQQHVPIQHKDYFLPSKKQNVDIDQIVSMPISAPETLEYLIAWARYTKEGAIEIELNNSIEDSTNLQVYINGQVVSHIHLSYDPDKKLVRFPYTPSDNKLLYLAFGYQDKITNTAIVLNQQKEITQSNVDETKLFNKLNNQLQSDSMEYVEFSRKFDPFIEIFSSIESKEVGQDRENESDEKEVEETDIVKESKNYYVNEKDIDWEAIENNKPGRYKSFAFELFDTVSRLYKLEMTESLRTQVEEKPKTENETRRISKQREVIAAYLKNFYSHLRELAIKREVVMDVPTFLKFFRDVVNNIPMSNLLMIGIYLRQPIQHSYQITWTNDDLYKVIPTMLRIFTEFWENAIANKTFLLDKLPKDYLMRFYNLSIKNLLVLDSLQLNLPESVILNRSNTDFLFVKALTIMSRVPHEFNLETQTTQLTDETSDKVFREIINKYNLDISIDENVSQLVTYFKKINIIEEENYLMKFMSKRKINQKLSLIATLKEII